MYGQSFRDGIAREAGHPGKGRRHEATFLCKRDRTIKYGGLNKNLLILLLDANDLFARKTTFLLQVYLSCSFIKENLLHPQDPK